MVTEVCNDRATIQWTVPSIAYTPETYVVEYGTSQDSLDLTSDSQHSGPDITVTNVSYSVQLSNLEPAIYHYQVVATNTADRSTASGVHAFLASASSKLCNNSMYIILNSSVSHTALHIQSSGDSKVGHHYTLTCTVHVSGGEQLKWRNSTGHTLNTSTGGHMTALELHFHPLRVSDGGQYTCLAEYEGGGSRQTSEVVLVTGESS